MARTFEVIVFTVGVREYASKVVDGLDSAGSLVAQDEDPKKGILLAQWNRICGDQVIATELRVFMHCKACEKSGLKTLAQIKGVEKVTANMEKDLAMVYGRVEPLKL